MSEAGASPQPRRRHRRDSEGDLQDVAAEEDLRNNVKSEPDDDIKDFAETTMNELLGWYGYDKVNTKDTRGLNLALNHFSSSSSPRAASPHGGSCSEDETRDTGGSRTPLLDTDTQASTGGTVLCTWCQKSGLKLFTLKTGSGESKAFCSELCFNQCRRAAFKKNRVCDWCKHVRHTVNYVDFQDGEHQLQFCSDKCLNQYKMNIFCKETQAYLQLHPQLQEACRSSSGSGPGSNLITPDLWLRDCKEAVNGHPSSSLQSEDENCAGSGGGCNGSGGEVEETFATKSGSSNGSGVSNPLLWEDAETRREPKMLTRHHHRDKSRRVGRPSSRHKESHESASHYRPPSSARSPNLPHLSHGILSPPSPSLPAPPPLVNGSSPSLHSSTSPNLPQPPPPPHPPPSSSASSIPPGLPPPLLNSDYFRPHFAPPMYHPSLSLLAQQQQLENFLRMQHGLGTRLGMPHPPHFPPPFPEPLLSAPPPAAAPPPPLPSSLIPPATVLVPYPVIIPLPLPIPIPIPIPLPHSLSKKIQESNKSTPSECCSESSGQSQSKRVDSVTKRVDSVITKLINNHRESGTDSTLTESQVSGRLKTRSPGPQMKRALDEDNDNLTSQPVPLTSPREKDVFRTFTKDSEEENQMTLTRSKSKTSRDSKRQRLRDKYGL